MTAIVVHHTNPFRPQDCVVQQVAEKTIWEVVPDTQLPFVCIADGEYILRKDWGRHLRDGEHVVFATLPQGGEGGGSQILAVVAMIVLTVVSMGTLAPMLAGAIGVSTTVAHTIIMVAGSMLIGALTPKPSLPSGQQQASIAAPSPTYSLAAQGNFARLEQAIPVRYGRMICFPDFGAQPYALYENEDQFLYQLFVIGQGEYDIEAIKIEDTPINNFSEVEYEIIPPGGAITLVETNIVSSPEVAGQELLEPVDAAYQYSVAVVAVPAGSQCNSIGVDIACPRGLFLAETDGSLSDITVSWIVQRRSIDNFGSPTGAWTTIGTESLTDNVTDVLRRSYDYAITAGRYEVRLARTNAKNLSSRAGNDLNWIGLRATLTSDGIGVTTCTMLAVKIRATNNLAGQSSRKINLIATRKLPTWDPDTGFGAAVATRSIAWAFMDALRNTVYSRGIASTRIDLQALYDLDQLYLSRQDYFDGAFDNRSTLWEALYKIARAGRALPIVVGGIVTMVRDSAETIPVALFNNRNIVAGSFSMSYLTETDESPDSIIGEYLDNRIWKPLRVEAPDDSGTTKPTKVQLFGITGNYHAQRETEYMVSANRYRRKMFNFETEMEGHIPSYGSLIAVSHDLPDWGQGGEVLAFDDASNELTLSEIPVFTVGTHYISLVRKNGSVSGPYVATATSDANVVVLATEPDFDINAGLDWERTRYSFGPSTNYYKLARVMGVSPITKERVKIMAVNEDDRVHTADEDYFGSGTDGVPPSVDSIIFYISTSQNDLNLFEFAGSPAVADDYVFVVNPGVVLGGTTSAYGVRTGTFPVGSTVTLINNGYIVGLGGSGGDGQSVSIFTETPP